MLDLQAFDHARYQDIAIYQPTPHLTSYRALSVTDAVLSNMLQLPSSGIGATSTSPTGSEFGGQEDEYAEWDDAAAPGSTNRNPL